MDERHQQFSQQQAAAPAPWPQSAPQPHQPWPQAQPQPHAQYQYAPAQGFVQPGAPAGHQPMSAQGGMIGVPMQPSHPDAMPMLHGAQHQHHQHQRPSQHQPAPGAPVQYAPTTAAHGGMALDPAAHQAWAFPTPNGLQLVQPGAPADATHAAAIAAPAATARRMRWETIVPGAAVACLFAAVALFISDFDRITGRDTVAVTPASSARAVTEDPAAASADADAAPVDAADVVREATELFGAGRFDDAANLLTPLLDVDAPAKEVVALHDRIEAAATRNDALLAQLQRQRRAGKWTAVLGTIGQLEQLRPLSPTLVKLRQQARTTIKARVARERARSAAAATRRRAAPSTARDRSAAPPAGGSRTTGSTPRPPASSPTRPASIPPRPDAPNPINSGGTGAAAVGGGAAAGTPGSDCHTHDGVTECH